MGTKWSVVLDNVRVGGFKGETWEEVLHVAIKSNPALLIFVGVKPRVDAVDSYAGQRLRDIEIESCGHSLFIGESLL